MAAELKYILCVDDEPDILEVAKMSLETIGELNVTSCASGKEGIRQAELLKPDIILLDVMMPGMDGPSTLKALRANPAVASIPVIFMTAKVQPSEVADYIALGAVGVIPKPFDAMALTQDVQTLWKAFQDKQ